MWLLSLHNSFLIHTNIQKYSSTNSQCLGTDLLLIELVAMINKTRAALFLLGICSSLGDFLARSVGTKQSVVGCILTIYLNG